ncbi:hypothetical protein AVEN_14239-1 [Araneus ventricosus]|uniref:Uncharacterized protein n=1 Tax=Araneus ventricosus TaxID=182803 RepID=A0A4Y2GK93_ARAVE|nr:hypothetical protein AVEN_14239-1 [Araneus ventricosus]
MRRQSYASKSPREKSARIPLSKRGTKCTRWNNTGIYGSREIPREGRLRKATKNTPPQGRDRNRLTRFAHTRSAVVSPCFDPKDEANEG